MTTNMKTETYRVVKEVAPGGRLSLDGLPFEAGDEVEVLVRGRAQGSSPEKRYPLRGKPVRYSDPFEGVDENGWEALQ